MRKSFFAAGFILAGLLASSAQAADKSLYFGASLGAARGELGDDFRSSLSSGFGSASLSEDKGDLALFALLGYQFNRNFALEGSWGHYGIVEGQANTTLPLASVSTERETTAFTLDAVGTLPLSERFDLTGKVGAAFWRIDMQTTTVLPVSSIAANSARDQSGIAPHYGVGLQYRLSDAARVTFDIGQFHAGKNGETGRSAITTVSAGFKIHF